MTQRGPRQIGDLLKSGSVARLMAEAAERRELAARVRAALAPEDADHLVTASVDESGCLVVGMDSAAWAARLRYSRESLLGLRLRVRVAAPGERSR
jgi:hypothetical protein